MLRVAFLWHLHQPDYRDPANDHVPAMPWVRLHALRGYRDMAIESARGGIPWTLNVVPSLLDQLDHYAGGGSDEHLDLTRKRAEDLSDEERQRIVATFVAGHPAMRTPWSTLAASVEQGRSLSTQELRDVQVWSTLQWFGSTARHDFEELNALIARGHGFSEDDKATMLRIQQRILEEAPGWWADLSGSEVSATAADHPILPLLVDLEHARRAMPDLPELPAFRWPDDARRQLILGRERVGRAAGTPPDGLWPSEGSVSPELLPLVAEAGFRWLCSDEHVLQRSDRRPGSADPDRCGPWDLGHGLVGWFRDTELSDEIGFRCAGRAPAEAASAFVDALMHRHARGTVLVALDGENPWETFPDAGGAFRRALVDALAEAGVELVTVGEACAEVPVGTVTRLHSGSWIGADYAVWVGDHDDRRAWALLARTRQAVHDAGPEAEERALPHLFAAEGSDWFWWFGERFSTPFDDRFDALFRAHLVAAHRAAGIPVPEALHRPVREGQAPTMHPPRDWLPLPPWRVPQLLTAGSLAIPEGSMARGHRPSLRFGWTRPGEDQRLVLHLEGDGLQLEVDGKRVGSGTHVCERSEARVDVVGAGGAVWPASVHLAPPSPTSLWGP